MKNLLTIITLAFLLLVGNAFAQDSTKTHDRTNFQGKEQKKKQLDMHSAKQKQNRANRVVEDNLTSETEKVTLEKNFIDADGDGVNDNALDADGDGIPNGQDPDYIRPQDGSGQMKRIGEKENKGSGLGGEDGTSTQQKSKQGGKK